MKISVGHILLVAGVGTYVFLGPMEGREKSIILVGEARNDIADKVPSLGFLRSPDRKAPLAPVAPVPEKPPVVAPIAVQDKLPAAEVAAPGKNFSEVPLTPVPPAPAKAEVVPPVPSEPTVEAPKKRPAAPPVVRRRRRSTAKPAAVSAEPAKKTANKQSGDNLVGTYVSLTLKTGNVVKGMLVERTATNYKIELPGMGAFDYPADTVKSVAAAE